MGGSGLGWGTTAGRASCLTEPCRALGVLRPQSITTESGVSVRPSLQLSTVPDACQFSPPTPDRCLCPGGLLLDFVVQDQCLEVCWCTGTLLLHSHPSYDGQPGVGDFATVAALEVRVDLPNESTTKKLRRGQKSEAPTATGHPEWWPVRKLYKSCH